MFCDILFDFILFALEYLRSNVLCFVSFEVAIEFRNVDKTHSIDQ